MPRRPSRTAEGHAAQGPAGGRGILLLWARDGAGTKVRADRLAAKDRRGRAPFTCLGCGEPGLRLAYAPFQNMTGIDLNGNCACGEISFPEMI